MRSVGSGVDTCLREPCLLVVSCPWTNSITIVFLLELKSIDILFGIASERKFCRSQLESVALFTKNGYPVIT